MSARDEQKTGVTLLARATVLATFALIAAGGLVTSRDAGLAVPDWPLSFGTLNPPGWYRIVNVRTEHGHRLVAGCVAILTAVLAWVVRRREQRPVVRGFAAAALGLVLFQAVLGGLRVLHLSLDLAMVHALTAQLFLTVVVVIATMTSPRWLRTAPEAGSRAGLACDAFLVAAVLLQLGLGIWIRHQGSAARPLLWHGVFHAHVILALAIAYGAHYGRSLARKAGHQAAVARGRTTLLLVAAQLALGVATFLVTEGMTEERQATLAESWLPTLHVLLGAAVLASAVRSLVYSLASRETGAGTAVAAVTAGGPTR